MRRAVRAFVLLASALLGAASSSAAAGTAELLRDIVPGEDQGGGGIVGPLVPAGSRIVFPAAASGGAGLWASDGTAQGTRLLRTEVSVPVDFAETVRQTALLAVGDRSGGTRRELWRSDGTAEGTFALSSATAGRPSACDGNSSQQHAVVKDLLFYTASGTSSSCELWVSNGTRTGTRSILDVEGDGALEDFTAAGNRLFFFRQSGLWISDGTHEGTVLVQAFAAVSEGPRELTAAGSRVFFVAQAVGGPGEELWISDGSNEGTRPLTGFSVLHPFGDNPFIRTIGTTVYFTADDGTGIDLWQSEGGAPARRVTNFTFRTPFGDSLDTPEIARAGSRLIFAAREEGHLQKVLWVSDGTPASTRRVTDCVGGCATLTSSTLVQAGSRVLFQGPGGLWATDGTGAGTRRVASVSFLRPAALLGKVFFYGPNIGGGFALWMTDGTPAGTVRLADLGPSPDPFSSFAPVQAGGRIFFTAQLGDRGFQLWSSDGTPAGTGLVTLLGGGLGSSPFGFVPFAGEVLFTAQERSQVRLWRSDGTPAGTFPSQLGKAGRVLVSGGLLFFLSENPSPLGPFHVWRTDGTEAGTFPVTSGEIPADDLVPYRNGVAFLRIDPRTGQATLWKSDGTVAGTGPIVELLWPPEYLTPLGSNLYFVALVGNHDQLWVSDGTAAGTQPLTAFDHYVFDVGDRLEMAQVGGMVFFATQDRLWTTHGTPAGTAEVPFVEDPTDLVVFRNALYFMAGSTQSPTGRGLWRSDGTAAGTYLVEPVGTFTPPTLERERAWPTILGDRLFFAADDGEHGIELWSTDGTPGGAVLVLDIAPGDVSARPSWLTVAAGRLYFAATDGRSGIELWESDGTAAETRRVHDILSGAGSSSPKELTASGSHLFFAADDGVHGEEPWALSLTAGGGCVPSADALCLGGRFRVEADWRDFQGNRGTGRAVALTADTGYFWFFDAANVEVILKVLDGRSINGHHWVFYGALSSVEYTLTVTDTQTGAVRRYINPPGRLGSMADTEAFGPRGASLAGVVTLGPAPVAAGEPVTSLRTAPATSSCTPGATRLCLQDGRFAVEASWKARGQAGTGQAVPLAGGDTGYFWFFDASNVEVVLKVLDGTPLNGKFWVFYGALSDVEYTLTVTDTQTGAVKTYTNPGGRLASVADTGAF